MSYVQDFSHAIFLGQTLGPASITATTNGNAVPIASTDVNLLTVVAAVGSVSGTSPTLSLVVQVSSNGTNWTDILTLPTITSGPQIVLQSFGIPPPAPDAPAFTQVRCRAVVGGTSPNFNVHVFFQSLLRHPVPQLGAVGSPPVMN